MQAQVNNGTVSEHPWETMTKKKRRKTSMTMIMSHCLMVNILCITQASVSLISTRIDSDYWNIKWNFLFCSLTLSRSFTVLTMAPCGMWPFPLPLLSFIFFPLFSPFSQLTSSMLPQPLMARKVNVLCECMWVVDTCTWFKIFFFIFFFYFWFKNCICISFFLKFVR